jgi:hypothetical protein
VISLNGRRGYGKARSVVGLVVAGADQLSALRLDRMKAHGKKFKRKRGPRMTFAELVQKLWQPESEELEQQVAKTKQKKSAAKRTRIRKS